MAKNAEDKPRKLPKKFRASTDPKDTAAFELLQANDEIQRERLGEAINAPYLQNSPLERSRSKAYITIEALMQAADFSDPDTVERLAEAYAIVGRYDMAASITTKHKALYERYWAAVWLPDVDWCNHPDQQKLIKEYVFSVKENREMPLLHCVVCDTWNVLDASYHNKLQLKREADIREATKGMSMAEKLRYLQTYDPKPIRPN